MLHFYKLKYITFLVALFTMIVYLKNSFINVFDKQFFESKPHFQHRNKTIPKIIHFIWNDEKIPNEFVENIKGFVKNNPTPRWTYFFWTKQSSLKFIQDRYANFYPKIKGMADLLRADIVRWLVIYEYGGVYFDLDTVSLKPLDTYVDSCECSLPEEPGEHCIYWKVDLLINNGALLCVPKHPFFKHVIDHFLQLDDKCKDAMYCTGPFVLTKLYRDLNSTHNKTRLPRLEPSEIFQDKYDVPVVQRPVSKKCLKTSKLDQNTKTICDKWKARGMEKRNISERALVYHTWYHTVNRKVTYSNENSALRIIPGVRIYA